MGVNGIYGLSGSGLDIESMVKVGMMSKQTEYDRMYKKEMTDEWIKSDYADIYSSLYNFNNSTLSTYNKQSTMSAMTATSSLTSAVTVTANGAAAALTHRVEVNTLSSAAYMISKNKITRENPTNSTSIYLKDSIYAGMSSVNTYTVGDKEYSADQVSIASGDDGANTYTIDGNTYSADQVTVNQKYQIKKLDGTSYAIEDMTSFTTEEVDGSKVTYHAGEGTDDANNKYNIDMTKLSYDASSGAYKLDGTALGGHLSFTYGSGDTAKTVDQDAAVATTDTNGKLKLLGVESSLVNANDAAIELTVDDKVVTGESDEDKLKHTVKYTYADLMNGKTLNDLSADINRLYTGQSANDTHAINVSASYDSINDAFTLYNKNGGTDNTVSLTGLTDDTVSLLNNLQLASTDGTTQGDVKTFVKDTQDDTQGTAGTVTIDGKVYSDLTSNKLTVSGVTYTFLNTTKENEAATVAVTQDTDTIVKNVKQFVEDYNKILDSLNDKIYETRYSDYEPLTQAQEESMSETQIDKWNAKAKSGLLQSSTILKNIVSSMRESIYTPVSSVESSYNSASAIGITSSTNRGHLTLDEDKLKAALAADPDCVYQIFASSQDSDQTDDFSKSDDYKNTGIANRLYFNVMPTALTNISNYAGKTEETDDQSTLGKAITSLQNKMCSFQTFMDAYEEQLYAKWDAVESSIASLSSQLSTVTSYGQ